MRRAAGLAVASITWFLSAGALADECPTTSPATAQSLFDEGQCLITHARYAEACPKLAESNRMDPSLGTLLWLAGCYEKVGQTYEAWSTFRSAEQIAHERHDEREARARARAEQLEATLPTLTIVVASEVSGLEVMRDGVVVSRDAWGKAAVVSAGAHEVTARAPGHQASDQRVQVPPSATVTVSALSLVAPQVIAVTGRLTPTPAPPATKTSPWLAVGWVTAAIGLVGGVAVGAAFGLDAKSKLDASNGPTDGCSGTTCNGLAGVTLRSQALSSALVSTVAFVAGGVLLAAGVVIVLVAPLKVSVTASRRGSLLSLGGTF